MIVPKIPRADADRYVNLLVKMDITRCFKVAGASFNLDTSMCCMSFTMFDGNCM